MVKFYNLSNLDIESILNVPEVTTSKIEIDSKINGSISFNIKLTDNIKYNLNKELGLNLTSNYIPMRWIKGDTPSHTDKCEHEFKNTYLIYLTDSIGELIINEQSFPIKSKNAYIFPEGLKHETLGTNNESRLMIGPMNEEGISVGGNINFNYPGGTTIYIRQNNTDIQYSVNNQLNWNNVIFPIILSNTDTNLGLLKIEFVTDITINNNNSYFICNSSHIQIGSISLKNDGTRPIVNINDGDYDGFIENGTELLNGFNDIYIYNIFINALSYNIQRDGGWLCKKYFSNSAINNYVINCSTNGNTIISSDGSGCLIGSYSGINNGNLYIYGCSSSGNIDQSCGGIVGGLSGQNGGSVTCVNCWSTGQILIAAGGIFGSSSGNCAAIKCYSSGSISDVSGGIFGSTSGFGGISTATQCYSMGNINLSAGGIFGYLAGLDSTTSATNCYSLGTTSIPGNGIYGSDKLNGTETNCYSANGTWIDNDANNNLQGVPSNVIGSVWVSTIINQPYELNNYGYTPYSINIINSNTNEFVQTYNQNIEPGQSTISAIIGSQDYTILKKSGGNSSSYDSITIDNTTGIISTTTETLPGVYTLYIRNTGSYNITEFILTIEGQNVPCLTEDTSILTPEGYINIKELSKDDYIINSNNIKQKIKNIFYTKVKGNKYTYPYKIPKDSISKNYPDKDTRISGQHLILFNNKWIHPCLSKKFEQDNGKEYIKYYHIELDNYETDHLVINNGLIVESFGGFNNDDNNEIYLQRITNNYKCKIVYQYYDGKNYSYSLNKNILKT